MDITHSNHSLWLHCSIAALLVRHRPTTSETKCDEQTEGHQIWQFPSSYRRHHLQHPDYIYNHPTSYSTMKPWRRMIEEVDWTPPSTWFGNTTNNEKASTEQRRQRSRLAKPRRPINQHQPRPMNEEAQWTSSNNRRACQGKNQNSGLKHGERWHHVTMTTVGWLREVEWHNCLHCNQDEESNPKPFTVDHIIAIYDPHNILFDYTLRAISMGINGGFSTY